MNKDREIVKFIEQFKAAKTNTIDAIFYKSLRYTQKKLKKLVDYGELQRDRDVFTFQYYYYTENKPKQLQHRLLLTDFCAEIVKMGFKIVMFDNEYSEFPELRPDGFLAYRYKDNDYVAFIETERSNKLNIQKYRKLYESGDFFKRYPKAQDFPKLIAVTNKKVLPTQEFEVVKIREDFSNINDLVYRD